LSLWAMLGYWGVGIWIRQTVLALGNAINSGTNRGAASGFRIGSLVKLSSTKARNGKTTLLHYLIKVLEDKMPDVLNVWADLKALEPTSRIELSNLGGELSALQKGLEAVEAEVKAAGAETDERSLNFCEFMSAFLSAAKVGAPR